ncbi:MAG: hypothetical protein ACFFFG_00570 [Candidatus Thorarchaeota archaeon]
MLKGEVRTQIKNLVVEVLKNHDHIHLISLTTPEGLPILTLARSESDNEVIEITDQAITNRYAALAGASTSLGERTLSTLSEEHVRSIHVQGKSRDVAIAVSSSLITLVVTKPGGSPNLIAEKINTELRSMI